MSDANQEMGYDGGLTAALSVKDMKAGIAWYRDVLGFELVYELEDMGWCELKSPVNRVNVGLSQVESPDVKGGTTLLMMAPLTSSKSKSALAKRDLSSTAYSSVR